jgi:hypothetical protein
MAKQKVLRDFSELRPLEKRIELVASGISQIVFKGQVNEDFRPREGTQVHRVWKMTKLDERQQIAWQQFCDDVNLAHGKSGSVCSAYGEATDRGDGSDFRIPTAFSNTYYRRIERLLTQFLDRKERALLYELLQDTLKANSSLSLEAIGLLRSGYSDKVSARAAGVTHIQCLLDRLAAYYGV